MNKNLSEMSQLELNQLFPIILSEHDHKWKFLYLNERALVENTVGTSNIVRINHYGSTSVIGLLAKPTIDILLEVKKNIDISVLIKNLVNIDYIYSVQPANPPPHMMFMKGYTTEGFKKQTFHLHVRYEGDWDELYFRDYLVDHPEIAKEYGSLKLQLQSQYEHDRDGYTLAKTVFIKRITEAARKQFGAKYAIINDPRS